MADPLDPSQVPPPPDTSGLGVEAPSSQYNLQNAEQAMTPQVPPPPTANPSAIKQLLTNFFHGMGGAMMKDAGLKTPEEQQQQQFQNQITQQNAQSLQGIRQAQEQQYGYTEIPDPQGGAPFRVMNRDAGRIQSAQIAAQAKMNAGQTTVTPEMVKANPELQGWEGSQVPAAKLMDLIRGKAVATINQQNKRPSAAARDDRYIALQGVDPKTWTTEDQQFMKGYEKFVDFTKVQPGLQRMNVLVGPRWAALDPQRQAQIAVAKSLGAGAFANQTTSFNAFLGHLGDFHDAVKELGNYDTRLLNKGLNELALQTGDPRIQGVIAKIEPVRKEFESLLLNNRALYEADRKSADVILSQNSSPAQIETAVKSLAQTAGIRLGALNSSVKRVAGADIPDLLEPANGAILEELGATVPGYGEAPGGNFGQVFGRAGRSNAPNAPPSPAKRGFTKFTESGTVYNIPNHLVNSFKKAHPNAR